MSVPSINEPNFTLIYFYFSKELLRLFRGDKQELDLLNDDCHLHPNIDSGQCAAAILTVIDDLANRISISNVLTKNLV